MLVDVTVARARGWEFAHGCDGNRAESVTSAMRIAHNATATRSGVICGSDCLQHSAGGNYRRGWQMGRRYSSHLHVRTLFCDCAVCIPFITRFYWRTHARVSSTDLAALLGPTHAQSPPHTSAEGISRGDFSPAAASRRLPASPERQDDISRPGIGEAHQAQHHNTHHRIAIYRMRIRLFAIHPHVRLPQLHATRRRPPYLATPSRTRAVTFRKPGHTARPDHLALASPRHNEHLDLTTKPSALYD